VAGMWLGDTQVLKSVKATKMDSVRSAASYPLIPYSNRIAHARLQWAGTSHPLVKNFEPEPHTIHGVGWERPWGVLESNDNFALLALEHKADPTWPFDFDASQAFKLERNALEMSLSITNQSKAPAPVGLGWHPYFAKRPGMRIQFNATGRWEMDDLHLPSHHTGQTGLDTVLANLTVDHCFDGWDGVLTLRDVVLSTRVTSAMRHLVVYSTPERDSIAVEPVSHANNALNLLADGVASAEQLGVRVLQPGESFSCEMRIEVEHTA